MAQMEPRGARNCSFAGITLSVIGVTVGGLRGNTVLLVFVCGSLCVSGVPLLLELAWPATAESQ